MMSTFYQLLVGLLLLLVVSGEAQNSNVVIRITNGSPDTEIVYFCFTTAQMDDNLLNVNVSYPGVSPFFTLSTNSTTWTVGVFTQPNCQITTMLTSKTFEFTANNSTNPYTLSLVGLKSVEVSLVLYNDSMINGEDLSTKSQINLYFQALNTSKVLFATFVEGSQSSSFTSSVDTQFQSSGYTVSPNGFYYTTTVFYYLNQDSGIDGISIPGNYTFDMGYGYSIFATGSLTVPGEVVYDPTILIVNDGKFSSSSTGNPSQTNTWIFIGITGLFVLFVVFLIIIGTFVFYHQKRKRSFQTIQ